MPQTKGVLEVSVFHLCDIVAQYDGRLSHHRIYWNLSIPLAAINRVIVKYTREGKKCTASPSGRPDQSDKIDSC